jgi:2-desacetyl-2-hydroxyethyl bacteriochlorophyllide A dehydrogenase
MRALVYHGKRTLTVEDVPAPVMAENEVLVQVTACGICGSDLHGYLGHSARREASIPLVMGHEFSGRIVALGTEIGGKNVPPLTEGSRVVVQPVISCGYCPACRAGLNHICPSMEILGIERTGAFTELVAVPVHRVFALPESVDELDAALTETLAVEVHLFRQMTTPLPRMVVVLGSGAQGLLALQLARLAGAEQVIVTDVIPQRLALAQTLGASVTIRADQEDVVEAVLDCTNGWGAELVIDTAGLALTRQQGVATLAPGGTLALIGLGEGETTLNFLPVVAKELNIRGSYCYSDDDFERAVELIAKGQVQIQSMIQTAPLNEGPAYFEKLADEPEGLVKVLLQPGQS